MCAIMEWSKTNVYSVLYICWGAQAGLYYHYGIQKYLMPEKLSGIFNHKVLNPYHPLMRGFDDNYFAPHSRYTEVLLEDIRKHDELIPLAVSDLAGIHICLLYTSIFVARITSLRNGSTASPTISSLCPSQRV